MTESKKADISLIADPNGLRDGYKIEQSGSRLVFRAQGIRGLIFAIGMFLRKIEVSGEKITLIQDIGGEYKPDKRIRGHQLGYRTTPNSYDAWDLEDYRRYYLDLMFFGCNTVEHIPYDGLGAQQNRLMKYDPQDFLVEASRIADEYDLDVSLWYPNDRESLEDAEKRRRRVFERTPRINVMFPPGGDPGDYDADEFISRCRDFSRLLKEYHPNAEMWPSAQQPHSIPNWGEKLISELQELPDEIDGIITGPNHAFEMDELRRRVPAKYPIRFYPDITHNVRCEYPVHFDRDDWHYALAAGLSRECTNPRPCEYREIHRLTRRYVVGSVSYSEGITDDVNKCVWSDMDFFPDVDVRDSLEDYSRLYFPSLPASEVATVPISPLSFIHILRLCQYKRCVICNCNGVFVVSARAFISRISGPAVGHEHMVGFSECNHGLYSERHTFAEHGSASALWVVEIRNLGVLVHFLAYAVTYVFANYAITVLLRVSLNSL